MFRKVYFFLLITGLFFSCKKETDKPVDEIPELKPVETISATPLDGGGVELFGKLVADTAIKEYGFYLQNMKDQRVQKISLTAAPTEEFKFKIINGLEAGVTYQFSAYVFAGGEIKYGEIKTFMYQGNKPIIINSFEPTDVHLGDTITIHGKNFDPKQTRVVIDNEQARILSVNDSIISCIVPTNIRIYNWGIGVRDADDKRFNGIKMSLVRPAIDSFTNGKGIGDTVEILGNHFDANRTSVYFGQAKARVLTTNRKKITAIVPENITSGTMKITVNAQLQDTISEASFTIGVPVISDVPASVSTGAYITLKGKNFHPEASYNMNRVFFNGVESDDIREASATELRVKVPAGAYPGRKVKVSVKVFNGTGYYTKDVNIADKWLMISSDLPFEYAAGGAFTLNNSAFVFAAAKDGVGPMALWKLDPSDASWDKIKAPANGKMAVLGNKAYLYSNESDDNFIEYDHSTGKWTPKAKFPGVGRFVPAMFAAGGQLYIGIGVNDQVYGAIQDFYRYSPSKNEWTRIADFPGSPFRNAICSFVIGSSAYLVGGATNSGQNDMWSYDTSTDKWARKADFSPAHGTTAFVLNGKGYHAFMDSDGTHQTNECWEYDPIGDSWSEKAAIGVAAREFAFSFILNGKAYAGGKTVEYFGKTDLFRADDL